ncbi:MAG: hypothetical protein ABIN61_09035 [candidate division WOR-3 bacterium]
MAIYTLSKKIQTLEGFMLVLDLKTNKRKTIEIPLEKKDYSKELRRAKIMIRFG